MEQRLFLFMMAFLLLSAQLHAVESHMGSDIKKTQSIPRSIWSSLIVHFFLRVVTLVASSDSFTSTTYQNPLPQIPVSSVHLQQCVSLHGLSGVLPVERYVTL